MRKVVQVVLSLFAVQAHAYVESPDSVAVVIDDTVTGLSGEPGIVDVDRSVGYDYSGVVSAQMWRAWAESAVIRGVELPMPGVAVPFLWNSGQVYAAGSTTVLPGLAGIESGRIGLVQHFGRFTLDAYGEASKHGYFNGLASVWGFGASLSFRISEKVSVSMFGAYQTTSRLYGPPALVPYMAVPNFGGYFDFSLGSRWGVQVGVQSYRSLASGRWETQPIVKPYYRLNEKTDIGIDVGGILYNLVRWNRGKRTGRVVNPTIGPPSGAYLPVGPPGSEPPGY